MHRLFVAVEPPETIKDQLIGVMEGVVGARWQASERLHLTVRFIGEVNGRVAEDIADALSRLEHPACAVALASVGVFERRGRPEAIWAGLAPHRPLRVLHDKVDRALAMAGVAPDTRAYLPHITVARLHGGSAPVGGWLAAHGALASEPWPVDELTLYESHLGKSGAHYQPVLRVALTRSFAAEPLNPQRSAALRLRTAASRPGCPLAPVPSRRAPWRR
ncbi:MAG: RNA 2',3'-cyclic phosphodiesterase [Sphingomonadaceae bacterium]|nr:RNA 2',3'-cyclic phosphodiesterase [Sphingomonadaceae bacterium]